jgi:UDP-N-acetylmuramate dehydrogenase
LVDQCGFKGLQKGHVGVHSKQALVLTHDGEGDASELLRLANQIQEAVNNRFGVSLEIEPIIFS